MSHHFAAPEHAPRGVLLRRETTRYPSLVGLAMHALNDRETATQLRDIPLMITIRVGQRRTPWGRAGLTLTLAAGVVKLADTQDLGSCAFGREGSSPFSGTRFVASDKAE